KEPRLPQQSPKRVSSTEESATEEAIRETDQAPPKKRGRFDGILSPESVAQTVSAVIDSAAHNSLQPPAVVCALAPHSSRPTTPSFAAPSALSPTFEEALFEQVK